jgi:hypothetical protein
LSHLWASKAQESARSTPLARWAKRGAGGGPQAEGPVDVQPRPREDWLDTRGSRNWDSLILGLFGNRIPATTEPKQWREYSQIAGRALLQSGDALTV